MAEGSDGPDRPKVLVWTLQRTGGTRLASSLAKLMPDARFEHEPFAHMRAFHGVTQAWRTGRADPSGGQAVALDALVSQALAEMPGLKHCVDTAPVAITRALLRGSVAAGYRHLVLQRRRSVDRLLSLHFAKATKAWGRASAARDDLPEPPPLPVEALLAHEEGCLARLRQVRTGLRKAGAAPLLVAYEDLYEGPAEARTAQLAAVVRHLGLMPAKDEDLQAWTRAVLATRDQGTRGRYAAIPGREELAAAAGRLAPLG